MNRSKALPIIGLAITAFMLLSFMGLALADDGIPPIPDSFYGDLTVNGDPAPVGVTLVAKINGVERGSYTTQQVGAYGSSNVAEPELWWLVKGTRDDIGSEIHFWIENYDGTLIPASGDPTATFESGADPRKVDLTFTGVELKAPWFVDDDNKVDLSDLMIVAYHFRETGAPRWIPADVDGDGTVGLSDLMIVAYHYGETW